MIGLAVLVLMLARVTYFYLAPDATLVGVIPDDAFYYLQMAKHRVADGFWTFDGTSAATGFHFLFAYFLATVYWLAGDVDWRHLYLFISVLASVCIAVSAYLTCRTAERIFDKVAAILAVAPFLTAAIVTQSTAMMESGLVLLFSALTVFTAVRDETPGVREQLAMLAIGLLGSLARTDFGMLPGVLFVCALVFARQTPAFFLRRTAILLCGAVAGVAVVLCQNYLISGHFAQASALVKLYWSEVAHHNLTASINLVLSSLLPFFQPLDASARTAFAALCLVPLAALIHAALTGSAGRGTRSYRFAVPIACLLVIVGYLVFYKHNSGALQVWYSANLSVPLALLLSGTCFHLDRKWRALVTAGVLALYAASALASLFTVPWPHQAGMMNAGIALRGEPSTMRFASWNAGIISYWSQKPIVNIDGLTNDEVLPYIKSNTLFDYLQKKNIGYVVDYEEMVTHPYLRRRGGYEHARTSDCLHPVRAIDGGAPGGTRLKIFKVQPGCVSH